MLECRMFILNVDKFNEVKPFKKLWVKSCGFWLLWINVSNRYSAVTNLWCNFNFMNWSFAPDTAVPQSKGIHYRFSPIQKVLPKPKKPQKKYLEPNQTQLILGIIRCSNCPLFRYSIIPTAQSYFLFSSLLIYFIPFWPLNHISCSRHSNLIYFITIESNFCILPFPHSSD